MEEKNTKVSDDSERRLRFGRLLADALRVRHLKQEQLASMLGTTQSSVSGWINGKYEPSAATVFAIERSLGVDPGHFSRPLGYLPVAPVARTVSIESAIAQSTLLDDEEKAALAAMYQVLVRRGTGRGGTDRPAAAARPPGRGRLAVAPKAPARPRSATGAR